MEASELRDFMIRQNLSEELLAKYLGVTEGAVRHWLHKRREIPGPVIRILRYCDDFHITLEEFCDIGE